MAREKTKMSATVRRRIQIIDRDLRHLRDLRWAYCKRMLKIGLLSWEIGVLAFTIAAFVWALDLAQHVSVWLPLLIVALASPLLISAVFIRKLDRKEKTLERLRSGLLGRLEEGMLKEAKKLHKK